MRQYRILHLPLCLVAAVGLLVGCSDDETAGPSGSETEASASESEAVVTDLVGTAVTTLESGMTSSSGAALAAGAPPVDITFDTGRPCEGGGQVTGTACGHPINQSA